MSREQDQRLVEAYERVVKGEDPKLDEGKEFTKSKQKWMQNRAKDLKSAIDSLPGEIDSGNANNILSTINGIESHLDVMKNSLKGVK